MWWFSDEWRWIHNAHNSQNCFTRIEGSRTFPAVCSPGHLFLDKSPHGRSPSSFCQHGTFSPVLSFCQCEIPTWNKTPEARMGQVLSITLHYRPTIQQWGLEPRARGLHVNSTQQMFNALAFVVLRAITRVSCSWNLLLNLLLRNPTITGHA